MTFSAPQARQTSRLSIWHYPVVTLAAARRKARAEAKKRSDGVDLREARRVEKERDRVARLNTFELTARAWHAQKDREWSAGYTEKVMRHLELHVFPWSGALAMEYGANDLAESRATIWMRIVSRRWDDAGIDCRAQ